MKKIIWISVFVFSSLFGLVPLLWGGSVFSFTGFILNGIGGIFGIWVGYKVHKYF